MVRKAGLDMPAMGATTTRLAMVIFFIFHSVILFLPVLHPFVSVIFSFKNALRHFQTIFHISLTSLAFHYSRKHTDCLCLRR